MIPKRLEEITDEDIAILVATKTPESRTLDYKQTIPGNTTEERKDFAADVSALANSLGGDLVYGVTEERDSAGKPTGVPDEAGGVALANADQETRRLEQLIRGNIAPKIPGLGTRAIGGFPAGPIIVVRVPRSWAGPHMVTTGESRFYTRLGAANSQMDVLEIRAAFAASDSLARRAADWHEERMTAIASRSALPVRLASDTTVALHLIPFSSFDPTFVIDPRDVAKYEALLTPLGGSGCQYRFNFNGYLAFDPVQDGFSYEYLQVFRNGRVESVSAYLISEDEFDGAVSLCLRQLSIESETLAALTRLVRLMATLNIPVPYLVHLSLLNVYGARIPSGKHFGLAREIKPIDHSILAPPPVLIEAASGDFSQLLRPTFDAIWQAAGLRGSPSYDASGHWVDPVRSRT